MTSSSDEVEVLRYPVDTNLYTKEALFRACYQFTDRCYLFLEQSDGDTVTVEFRKREAEAKLQDVVGSFANELINQRVRSDLSRETQAIRELIVAQAFSDADLGEPDP
jgi:His-Xaa-Ser system protein HxsD